MARRYGCPPRLGDTPNISTLRMKKTIQSACLPLVIWANDPGEVRLQGFLRHGCYQVHRSYCCETCTKEYHVKFTNSYRDGSTVHHLHHTTDIAIVATDNRMTVCLGQTPDIHWKNVQLNMHGSAELMYPVNGMSSDIPFLSLLNNILPTSMA